MNGLNLQLQMETFEIFFLKSQLLAFANQAYTHHTNLQSSLTTNEILSSVSVELFLCSNSCKTEHVQRTERWTCFSFGFF